MGRLLRIAILFPLAVAVCVEVFGPILMAKADKERRRFEQEEETPIKDREDCDQP